MAVTEHDLSRFLKKAGVEHAPAIRSLIPFPFGSGSARVMMTVGVAAGLVQFRTIEMLKVHDRGRRRVLFQALLEANENYKVAKFGFDDEAGEIVAFIDVLVGDGGMTQRQFDRCLSIILTAIIPTKLRCQTIIETGEDSGKDSPVAAIQAIEQLMRMAGEAKRQEAPAERGKKKKEAKRSATGIDNLVEGILREQGADKKKP